MAREKSIVDKLIKSKEISSDNQEKLKVLITICDIKKVHFYLDYIQSFDVNFQFSCKAYGTSWLLDDNKSPFDDQKIVILSVVKESKVEDILDGLEEKFKSLKDGKGVSCVVPMSSVVGVFIYGFLSNNEKLIKERN